MKVVFSPLARRDRREALAWYSRVSVAVAASFRVDLLRDIRYISEYPHGTPVLARTTRGKTMRRFPYTIVYRVDPDEIVIVGIAHEARDPSRLL